MRIDNVLVQFVFRPQMLFLGAADGLNGRNRTLGPRGNSTEAPPAADEARRVLAQRSGFFKGVSPAANIG